VWCPGRAPRVDDAGVLAQVSWFELLRAPLRIELGSSCAGGAARSQCCRVSCLARCGARCGADGLEVHARIKDTVTSEDSMRQRLRAIDAAVRKVSHCCMHCLCLCLCLCPCRAVATVALHRACSWTRRSRVLRWGRLPLLRPRSPPPSWTVAPLSIVSLCASSRRCECTCLTSPCTSSFQQRGGCSCVRVEAATGAHSLCERA
jgi:hypothetical protein